MKQDNLISPSDFQRRGNPTRAQEELLTEEELQRIRALYDAALVAAVRVAQAGTAEYEAALRVEVEKRRPQINRIHRKAERRHKHKHPKP